MRIRPGSTQSLYISPSQRIELVRHENGSLALYLSPIGDYGKKDTGVRIIHGDSTIRAVSDSLAYWLTDDGNHAD